MGRSLKNKPSPPKDSFLGWIWTVIGWDIDNREEEEQLDGEVQPQSPKGEGVV
jgi:hypothetical protein